MIPEGVIDVLAALEPFEAELPADTPDVLLKLHSAFERRADFKHTGDHVERAVLTLGDVTGLGEVSSFERLDTWQHDEEPPVRALSAFTSERFINVEISAQLLLAWSLWRSSSTTDLSYLDGELRKLWLTGSREPSARGLPYLTRQPKEEEPDPVWYDFPMLDPTAYFLFYRWGFNPMAPGATSLALDYDFQECETDYAQTGNGTVEGHPDAIGDQTLPIGSEPNEVTFPMHLHRAYAAGKVRVRYSDDVPGNVIDVHVDGTYRGTFTTGATGGWNTFAWSPDIALGAIAAGAHSVKLVSTGGTYGANLDVLRDDADSEGRRSAQGWARSGRSVRQTCRLRTVTLCEVLATLTAQGRVRKTDNGYVQATA